MKTGSVVGLSVLILAVITGVVVFVSNCAADKKAVEAPAKIAELVRYCWGYESEGRLSDERLAMKEYRLAREVAMQSWEMIRHDESHKVGELVIPEVNGGIVVVCEILARLQGDLQLAENRAAKVTIYDQAVGLIEEMKANLVVPQRIFEWAEGSLERVKEAEKEFRRVEKYVDTAVPSQAADISKARSDLGFAHYKLDDAWRYIEEGNWGAAMTAARLVDSYAFEAREHASTPTPVPTLTP